MIVWHFIKWMLGKVFNGFAQQHDELKHSLNRHPGETFFFWLVVVLVLSAVQLLLVALVGWLTNTSPSFWWISGFTLTMVIHFVYTVFSVLFARFKRERAELFNTIKNSN